MIAVSELRQMEEVWTLAR